MELSGLPMLDRARNFVGYRGFGVCRDLDGLARLEALRRTEFFSDPPAPQPLSADVAQTRTAQDSRAADTPAESDVPSSVPEFPASIASETSQQTDLETEVDSQLETPKNVLPFRPVNEPKSPSLTPVENSAFNELARQLAARLENETGAASETPAIRYARACCRTPGRGSVRTGRRSARLAVAAGAAAAWRERARQDAARSRFPPAC